jgi:inorganic pyrophosphatase
MRSALHALGVAVLSCWLSPVAGQGGPPPVLPLEAAAQLERSLEAASGHAQHIWRDTPPVNDDGTVNAYVEIPRGDRRKYEFDMAANRRAIDRVMPEDVGGYPVNYGFVPQTISYEGDPFDALVLGPALRGGDVVRGVVVGLMHMNDEKGADSKVVLARAGPGGEPLDTLMENDRLRIGDYFLRYKRHESGKHSEVPGWADAEAGLEYVRTAHAFFLQCRNLGEQPCTLGR